jgi:hypothetical protein
MTELRFSLALQIGEDSDSKRAHTLLQMSGFDFEVRQVPKEPMLWDGKNHYIGLRRTGGIEWIMKGRAPQAFAAYVEGELPPENTPFRCVHTDLETLARIESIKTNLF